MLRRIRFGEPVRKTPEEKKVRKFVKLAEDLIRDDRYEFASEFLESVIDFYDEHGYLTPKQMEAIDNVKHSLQGH